MSRLFNRHAFSDHGEHQLHTVISLTTLFEEGIGFFRFNNSLTDPIPLPKRERIRISERTCSGLARTRASGTRLGRPSTLTKWVPEVQRLAKQGRGVRVIARHLRLPVSSAPKLIKQFRTYRAGVVKN
jgi:hypothetical protein